MIRNFVAAVAATVALSGSALAGPYANFERNDGFAGSDHSAINELHIGIDGALGESVTGYAQIGPAIVQPHLATPTRNSAERQARLSPSLKRSVHTERSAF